MDSNHQIQTIEQPSLLVSLSPMGDAIGRAFESRMTRDFGRLPDCLSVVSTGANSLENIHRGLASVLNVRHHQPGAHSQNGKPRRNKIQVLLVGAAVEWEDLNALHEAVALLEAEFRRCHLYGSIDAIIYVGSNDSRQTPHDDRLRELDLFPVNLAYISDSDSLGRRYIEEDVVKSIASVASQWLCSASLQAWVHRHAAVMGQQHVRYSIGIGRLNLSETQLHAYLRDQFQRRLFDHLFDRHGDSVARGLTPLGEEIDATMENVFRAEGASLGKVAADLEISDCALREARRQARRREASRQNAIQISALRTPGLWERMRSWFRRSRTEEPSGKSPGQQLNAHGMDATTRLLQIKLCQLAMAPEYNADSIDARAPFEYSVGDLPEVQATLINQLPDIKQAAWQFIQELPLKELLAECKQTDRLQSAVASQCDQLLSLDKKSSLVEPRDLLPGLHWLAKNVVPMYPATGTGSARLALLPEKLAALCPQDCEVIVWPVDEAVFVALEGNVLQQEAFSELKNDK